MHSDLTPNQFVLILATDYAKTAWDAWQKHYEGIGSVNVSKLQMFMS